MADNEKYVPVERPGIFFYRGFDIFHMLQIIINLGKSSIALLGVRHITFVN
jgi:hypothetical protein